MTDDEVDAELDLIRRIAGAYSTDLAYALDLLIDFMTYEQKREMIRGYRDGRMDMMMNIEREGPLH